MESRSVTIAFTPYLTIRRAPFRTYAVAESIDGRMDVRHAGKAAADAATNMIICPSILQLIYFMRISVPGFHSIPEAVSVKSSKSA